MKFFQRTEQEKEYAKGNTNRKPDQAEREQVKEWLGRSYKHDTDTPRGNRRNGSGTK